MVRHEAGARAEDGKIAAALLHLLELLSTMLSRSSSSLIRSSLALGIAEGSLIPAICRLRQSSSAFGAVV